MKIELTEDLDAETGLLMTKRRRSDEEEAAEEEEEDQLDGDCEDDDIICDNYLPTPLNNAGRWNGKKDRETRPITRREMRLAGVWEKALRTYGGTDRRTDGRTDGHTLL